LLRVCFLFYEYSDQIWDYIKSVPLDYIGPKKEIVSKEMIEKAHNLGSRVFTYVINDRVLGGNLIGLGIDAIGTDYPQLFGEFLSS
jgi:glycerophosphoryl diester phosphodiesterase